MNKAVEAMLANRAAEHIEGVLSRNCDCSPCQAIKRLVKQRDENTAELLALRKVADAAVAIMILINDMTHLEDLPDSVEHADLGEALVEAGR